MKINPWIWVSGGIWVGALVLGASTLTTTKQFSIKRHRVTQERPALITRAASAKPGVPSTQQKASQAASGAPLPDEVSKKAHAVFTLRLIGTSPSEVDSEAIALFEDPEAGNKQICHVGEELQGRQLVEIARGYILMVRDGKRERFNLEAPQQKEQTAIAQINNQAEWQPVINQVFHPQQPITSEGAQKIKQAIQPVSSTEHIVNRSGVWDVVKDNPLQVMREAGIQPAFEGMRLVGLRLSAIPDDGVLKQSGFMAGDIIQEVNGQNTTNPNALMQLPQQLQAAGIIEVKVVREGRPLVLTYRMQ